MESSDALKETNNRVALQLSVFINAQAGQRCLI